MSTATPRLHRDPLDAGQTARLWVRLTAGAVAVSSVLAVAWSLGAGGCGNQEVYIWECANPTTGMDLGSADNGEPDACPCGNVGGCCSNGPVNGKTSPQGNCPYSDAGDQP